MIWKLILSFLQVGLFSFGGGYAAIPLIRNQVVDTYGLITPEEFADLVTIAEMTPGPDSLNAATYVGLRCEGLFGAIICSLACVTAPVIISLIFAKLYMRLRNSAAFRQVMLSLRPAIAAMIGVAALKLLLLAVFGAETGFSLSDFQIFEAILFVTGLWLLRKKKCSAIQIILGSGFVGTVAYFLWHGILSLFGA